MVKPLSPWSLPDPQPDMAQGPAWPLEIHSCMCSLSHPICPTSEKPSGITTRPSSSFLQLSFQIKSLLSKAQLCFCLTEEKTCGERAWNLTVSGLSGWPEAARSQRSNLLTWLWANSVQGRGSHCPGLCLWSVVVMGFRPRLTPMSTVFAELPTLKGNPRWVLCLTLTQTPHPMHTASCIHTCTGSHTHVHISWSIRLLLSFAFFTPHSEVQLTDQNGN